MSRKASVRNELLAYQRAVSVLTEYASDYDVEAPHLNELSRVIGLLRVHRREIARPLFEGGAAPILEDMERIRRDVLREFNPDHPNPIYQSPEPENVRNRIAKALSTLRSGLEGEPSHLFNLIDRAMSSRSVLNGKLWQIRNKPSGEQGR